MFFFVGKFLALLFLWISNRFGNAEISRYFQHARISTTRWRCLKNTVRLFFSMSAGQREFFANPKQILREKSLGADIEAKKMLNFSLPLNCIQSRSVYFVLIVFVFKFLYIFYCCCCCCYYRKCNKQQIFRENKTRAQYKEKIVCEII